MNSTALRVASRVNRPGPQRRCPPCPACGEDAMRQYGAKHHGVVHRYFYACQHCQHTDVWREIQDGLQYFERIRQPLVPPRPEQCRLELANPAPKKTKNVHPVHEPDYGKLYTLCKDGDIHEIRAYLKTEFALGGEVIPVLKGLVAMRAAEGE